MAPGQTVAGTVDDQMILSNLKTIATSIEAIKSKPPDYVPAYILPLGAVCWAHWLEALSVGLHSPAH